MAKNVAKNLGVFALAVALVLSAAGCVSMENTASDKITMIQSSGTTYENLTVTATSYEKMYRQNNDNAPQNRGYWYGNLVGNKSGTWFFGEIFLVDECLETIFVSPLGASAAFHRIPEGFSVFHIQNPWRVPLKSGDLIRIYYDGTISLLNKEICVLGWKLNPDIREQEYSGPWIDLFVADRVAPAFDAMMITAIYADCFFAEARTADDGSILYIKINGKLSYRWDVGDIVQCKLKNIFFDWEENCMEADLVDIAIAEQEFEEEFEEVIIPAYKPVIYLYPPETAWVNVKLELDGGLTCTYPSYGNGWSVKAEPDGTLTDAAGQTYNYLYWEGETYEPCDFSQGFCVPGQDTAAFLEDALGRLGLTRREANEFIVYWLPKMEPNPYNIISFQTDNYTNAARLEVDPAPDTLIRVFMAWQAADEWVDVPAQTLTASAREGFTVVEWGGTEVKE